MTLDEQEEPTPVQCHNCGEPACKCCPDCEGDGYHEQAGSCGGGCEFCPPFPTCGACRGTGKRRD